MLPEDNDYYCWVCAHIDSAFLKNTKAEMSRHPEYEEIEAFIPTIKVLKKTFKKEHTFDEIPLLFNYGFFKIPRKFAVHRRFLDDMQKNISCIYSWVKDPVKATRPHGGELEIQDIHIFAATATSKEIAELIKQTINIGAHGAEDLNLLKEGDLVTLRGYPWEGLEATLLEIDHKKQRVKVQLVMFSESKQIYVSFDNVFFTIYHNKNYDDSLTIKNSLEAMNDNNQADKAHFKNYKPSDD